MNARALLLCGAVSLLARPARAQHVEYLTGTTHYRVTTTTKGSQTTPLGNSDFELAVNQRITLELERQAKDTLLATITLDSIALTGAAGAPDLSGLMGAKFVSLVSPTGRIYSTKPPSNASPLLSQFAEGIARVLPAYRADLRRGATWSDTTAGKMNQQGMDVDRTIIDNYTVEGDTTIAGEKAFKIARVTTARAVGRGDSQGTPVSLESSSTSNGAFFLSARGEFLGGTSTDDVDLTLKILAQGAEISMKQNAHTTIEPVR
jgi:hypothetical protein